MSGSAVVSGNGSEILSGRSRMRILRTSGGCGREAFCEIFDVACGRDENSASGCCEGR